MSGIDVIRGSCVVLDRDSVDTDAIYPFEFNAEAIEKGRRFALFGLWRREDPDFVLNQPGADQAVVLVGGAEFGIGSSREMAVWALQDWGFRAIVATSFGQIFRLNCGQNDVVAATVTPGDRAALGAALSISPRPEVELRVDAQSINVGDISIPFAMDDFARRQIISGSSELELILEQADAISRYESGRSAWLPTTQLLRVGDTP